MKIALVYDRVNKIGGAEKVLLALHEIWPKASLFTAVYNKETAAWANDFNIKTSFMQKFPFAKKSHRFYPWLTPFAFESFSFDKYDVVLSVTSAEAKAVISKPDTLHICYCLTPTRYLYSGYKEYLKQPGFGFLSFFAKKFFKFLAPKLKKWDLVAAQRPDEYLAISNTVKKRIKKYYKRKSKIIFPPVETNKFKPRKNIQMDDFFLIISRLEPYKRIDLAVKAFNQLGLPLKIIGTGSMKNKLNAQANENIEFLGQLTDKALIHYYQTCRAFIMPQNEDFGIAAVEAQAAGRPVIAYKKGGALDTIIENKTGIFFEKQTVESIIKAVKEFESMEFKVDDCLDNAQKFDKNKFKKQIKKFVEDKCLTIRNT